MFLFAAQYLNIDTDETIKRKIEFDNYFIKNEKQCYIWAMQKAYSLKKENELLHVLEFIGC